MKVYFIAIGGSVMHNLAIAMKKMGHDVHGSDDEINEPSRSRLHKYGLLPEKSGWDEDRIDPAINAVILGMHARVDNPELKRALELNIPVYSYPEWIYKQSQNKKRVVVAGSHGKTTITAMIMHVLKHAGQKFDYLVGAQLEGFDTMVQVSDAPLVVLEGDEYLSSAIDRRPKFHLYHADIAIISGIAWDHINVFPTYENYVDQFRLFIQGITERGAIIYDSGDLELNELISETHPSIERVPYSSPDFEIIDGVTHVSFKDAGRNIHHVTLSIFGEHNLRNMEGARQVCRRLDVSDEVFYHAMTNFKGASKRLELLESTNNKSVYRDFAHSPSKLKATVKALRSQFPQRKLCAVMELHTFSSLNGAFLDQYANSMSDADIAVIYYDLHTLKQKKLPDLDANQIQRAFNHKNLFVFNDNSKMDIFLNELSGEDANLLLMSSGTFGGLNLVELVNNFTGKSITQ